MLNLRLPQPIQFYYHNFLLVRTEKMPVDKLKKSRLKTDLNVDGEWHYEDGNHDVCNRQ